MVHLLPGFQFLDVARHVAPDFSQSVDPGPDIFERMTEGICPSKVLCVGDIEWKTAQAIVNVDQVPGN